MFSSSRLPVALAACLAAVASWCAPARLLARHPDSEADLKARIGREQNPVKKAKYEIRLGRVFLTEAAAAYDKGDPDRCDALAGDYLAQIKDAWQLLRGTGRNPLKKPDGFRDLDIALREDARLLDDLQHRIPYDEREPVSKVAQEVNRIHAEVIQALFPQEPLEPKHRRAGFPSVGATASLDPAAFLAFPSSQVPKNVLTEDEADKLREEQDPGKRIELYIVFAQDRLNRFVNFRNQPADPAKYDVGDYLDQLLGQYIAIDDEMKDWIDDQYSRGGDMRKGLQTLLAQGPQQLAQLRQIQQTPDAFARDYSTSLHDAIDDLTDTLDGATKALADQVKKFGELKKEEKAQARESKERQKEERKRTKEEKKLQKKERKQHQAPEDEDEQ
ncbi:MAG TPA: hypothetical protein VJV74_08225 [Terriglobia bacterium]|nr:hypothetical protein [Terriglobia bacterium]